MSGYGIMPDGRRGPVGRIRRSLVSSLLVALLATSAVAAASVAAASSASASGATETSLPARIGAAPDLPRGADVLGALSAQTLLHVDVVLQPRNPAALAQFASEVSTPGSPLYRHFLPRGAFTGRFGPTSTAIASVERSLRAGGLRPGAISGNDLSIPVTASAAAFAKAFSTSFVRVETSGRVAYANTSGPLFAGAVKGYVAGVIGLDNLYEEHPLLASPHLSASAARPGKLRPGKELSVCSGATTAASDDSAFTAPEIASMYNFSSLYSAGDEGSGITVGLYELEPYENSDISAYKSCYGEGTSLSDITEVSVDGGAGTGAGSGESVLDIEDLIGLDPDVTIDVYEAPNSYSDPDGAYDNYSAMVSQDKVDVISTSWGACEPELPSGFASEENTLFEEAASQGQSVFSAAGDAGSDDCYDPSDDDNDTSLAVDDPSSQPYVTGVGGTTTTGTGSPPDQTVWNDWQSENGAGGGGSSSLWQMPSYQSGAASSLDVLGYFDANSSFATCSYTYCRETPDVSADADPDSGIVYYYDGSWGAIGGTSVGAPLWAGLTALVDDYGGCGGTSIGFANPVIYKAAASSYSGTFYDVTTGNNWYTSSDADDVYDAGADFDMASGLGTPDAYGLAQQICQRVPNAPTGVTASQGSETTAGNGQVSLSWTAPSGNGSTISGYAVTTSPSCSACTGLSPAGTSTTVAGLTPGTSYTFDVAAKNSVGTGPVAASGAIVPVTIPGAPTGVTTSPGPGTTPGDGEVHVSWGAAAAYGSTVSGYTVVPSPACSACTGLSPTGTSSTVTGLTPGTSYSFSVTAKNSAGSGAAGVSGSDVPTTVPGVPGSVSASQGVDGGPGDAEVNLTWTAPAAYGSAVTGYTVTPSPACAACGGLGPSGTSTTVTGLTPGTSYTFNVTATNSVGTGPAGVSNSVSAPATVPSAPSAVSASPGPTGTAGDSEIALSWTAPSANGATITGYTVTPSPACSGCGGLHPSGASTTVSGLTPGVAYTFSVTATNSVGTGPTGVSGSETAPATVPGTPTGVTAGAGPSSTPGDGEIDLSWTAPAANGAAITGYTVVPSPPCSACGGLGPSGTSTTVTGLTPGATYTFTVAAKNSAGTGAAGTSNSQAAPATAPSAPTSVSASPGPDNTPGNGEIDLSWAAAAANGAAVTTYTVVPSPACPSCTGLVLSGTSTTITGLTPGDTYTFDVTATNSIGTSTAGVSNAEAAPATVPGQTTSVVATPGPNGTPGDGEIDLSWSAPAANGAAINAYVVTPSPACSGCAGLSPNGTATTVSGLSPGTSYTFTVAARNSVGTGATGTSNAEVAPATAPNAPSSVTATPGPNGTPGDGEIDLSWSAPAANGDAISGYTVTPSPGCAACQGLTPSGTSTTVSGLNPGTSYTFSITATNAVGTGPPGVSGSEGAPATVPGQPTSIVASPGPDGTAGNGEIDLSWTTPSANGATISGYTVVPSPTCTGCGGLSPTVASTTVTGLTPATTYTFTVVARNSVGAGAAGTSNSEAAPATAPDAPGGLVASEGPGTTAGDGEVDLSWSAPAANGQAISGYSVAPSPACAGCSGLTPSGTSTTVAGLAPGTDYSFFVTADNSVGSGPAASVSETPETIPSAPANVIAALPTGSESGQIFVSWSAAPGNGSSITHYTVSASPSCSGCGLPGTTTSTSMSINGLTPGTTYTFSVTASNAVGTGAAGVSNAEQAPAAAPAAPGAVTVKAGPTTVPGDGKAGLSWTAPADNGSPIGHYTVSSSPACTACSLPLTTTATSLAVSGLAPGTSYTFSVTATNSVNTGPAGTSGPLAVYTVPSAPRSATAKMGSAGSVVVTFAGPLVSGGASATSYQIVSSPACSSCHGTTTSSGSATITGLAAGTRYKFAVRALNRAGPGGYSAWSNALLLPVLDGYWLAMRNGTVFGFGSAPAMGGMRAAPTDPVVAIAGAPGGKGYFVATADGTVGAFGSAHSYGDLPGEHIDRTDIVSIVSTDDGRGYWLLGADGEVYTFGDAPFHGSLLSLAHPVHVSNIVGMVACAGDAGYLLIGSDGGVFAFGSTHFYGSLPGIGVKVNDIRGILPSATNKGYVLVGADGGAFVFGTGTHFYGSLPGRGIKVSDVVGLAITPDGGGYYMAAAKGAVYGFGDAKVFPIPKSLPSNLPVAAVAGV